MNRQQLDAFLAERVFMVEEGHFPHCSERNTFCALYIGTGRPHAELYKLRDELRAAGIPDVIVSSVTNPDHENHGLPMVEIRSYWNE